MKTNQRTLLIKITLSGILLLLAIFYWLDFLNMRSRVDQNFIFLLGAALLIVIIPWERLQSLKAGPLEFALERPQVQDVLRKLPLDDVEDKHLRQFLTDHSTVLATLQESRVLWIDDNPAKVVGERRLFRALGLDVIPAISSEVAEELLVENPDFDLIITDVQRKGHSYQFNNGIDIHEGVNFIVKLHTDSARDTRISGDLVKVTPVIFYAAYDRDRLVEFTKPARDVYPEVDICNDLNSLIVKAVSRLSEVRNRTTQYPTAKKPTPA